MRTKFYFSFLSLVILLWSVNSFSQSVKPEKILKPVGFDISKKLSDVKPIPPGLVDRTWKDKLIPNKEGFLDEFKTESTWKGPDPVLQNNLLKAGTTLNATLGKNFAGQDNKSGVAPPDTQGDVSANYYVQMVNLSLQIWDKNGNSLYGPTVSSTLWDGFTGPWTGTNDGDPIVLYDQIADRWIATQFSLPNYPAGPFYELVAVSQTNNPLGVWNRYAYEFVNMPDYPKFGVWSDGYYMTMNQFKSRSGSFAGAAVSVLNRDAMLAGSATASMQFFNLGTSYGSLLPADADGPVAPPTGSGNYLASLGTNSLNIWEAKINWMTPSLSTVSLANTLATQSFSYSGITIKQPGTTQTLDALASRLMYRLQYRNFGSYEVMLTNHTVNADGKGQAGVRWYELRKPTGGTWSIYQQGTYAPADGNGRWMGSVAMNGNGDIGLGYSVSGVSYPSIRYAGQTKANSGTGVLDVSEASILEGSVAQTGVNRWGDYSMMSIDPDDQTFWYTTEYSNGGWNWKTQIASFSFAPPVVIKPVANFSGDPVNVIAGQNVTFTDQSSNSPTSWSWTFSGGTPVAPSTTSSQNPVVIYPTVGTYNVSLTATNSAGSNTITKTGFITVTNSSTTYCVSKGSNTSKEWIQSVTVGSNPTIVSGNNNGYKDYTGTILTLLSGSSTTITLSPGFPVKSRAEYWRVWIDYNMNGDFLDANELVFSADAQKIAATKTITVPSGLTGQTRMRVSMQYNTAPTSCQLFTYGEVEDYTVSFTSPPAAPVATLSESSKTATASVSRAQNISLDLYPNPASNLLNVVVTGASENVNIKVYNALGQIIKDFDVKNSKATINLSNYQKGMYYIGVDDGVQNALKKFIKE